MGNIDGVFLSCMERILRIYALPYDPKYPVVCFDERPCFLIGDSVSPIPTQEGKVAKQHYAYEKNGSCCLLAAIEPLQGKRIAKVYKQRTKKEYTLFMQQLANSYPDAVKIRLIQDNLNTHNFGSFYEHLNAEEAEKLAQRFELHYTPKCGSWLNMIEIEFSALSKQCLDRRIPTMEKLETEINAIVKERNDKQIKINWQFTVEQARETMNSKYEAVHPDNSKYKVT